MLNGFLALLLCQLLGEWVVLATSIPVPGPVVGMVMLLVLLMFNKRIPESVRSVSESLLRYLAFLYVPAGVGLMLHLEIISDYWLAILVSLFVSTFITLLVTAWIFKILIKKVKKSEAL
ncbi:CidA/LrgA family protein [Neptunomonas antarctica]|uniref:Holin-like protein n=1 Tax=Neptunomonas antarctica TaxID=619304 RepID=A0A1N7PFM3_9GAMM|nr:CidA/LrgA family protein [Neptunomonas antarctica]SIT09159.1 holin-like protein [Neptunomonas antarctica]